MPTIYNLPTVQADLGHLLAEALQPAVSQECLNEPAFKFFFISKPVDSVTWSPKPLQKDMASVLGNQGIPSHKTLNAFKRGQPIFLGNAITLHRSLIAYAASRDALFRKAMTETQLASGLPQGSVRPSLQILDDSVLRVRGCTLLQACMSRYGISKADLADNLERLGGSADGYKLIDTITRRCFDGTVKRNPGEARVTLTAASNIWQFLQNQDEAGLLTGRTLADMFNAGPSFGSGNGRWTGALTKAEGNIV